jgi:disulfide bond formation protein DsbB
MTIMMTLIKRLWNAAFYCPHFILMALGGISIAALTAALISQYGFNMHPCYLCLWQRIPYAVVILLSVMGVFALKVMGKKYGAFNIALCGIAFLINSGIAFYHVGVEQHWWSSSCSFKDLADLAVTDMAAAIKAAPTVSCDQIPFELFGISMAGYNVLLCGGLGFYSLIASRMVMTCDKDQECCS